MYVFIFRYVNVDIVSEINIYCNYDYCNYKTESFYLYFFYKTQNCNNLLSKKSTPVYLLVSK